MINRVSNSFRHIKKRASFVYPYLKVGTDWTAENSREQSDHPVQGRSITVLRIRRTCNKIEYWSIFFTIFKTEWIVIIWNQILKSLLFGNLYLMNCCFRLVSILQTKPTRVIIVWFIAENKKPTIKEIDWFVPKINLIY